MSTTGVVVVLVVLAALAAAAAFYAGQVRRRRRLEARFGPEYERTVSQTGNRREAERELAGRERRHADLGIAELEPEARERYARQWIAVQEAFVDSPETAVGEADRLVGAVMAERGYPDGDVEERLRDLSVEHAGSVDHYRAAHTTAAGTAGRTVATEDLRQAMVHFRAVFEELLGEPVRAGQRSTA